MSASIEQVKYQIDQTAQKHGFRCQSVSWEDCTRSNGGGFGNGLSSVGPNISDVRLYERTGRLLYTVRSQNWNERLGYVAASDVALMTGNEKSTASALSPTTLATYLQNIGTHAAYAGVRVPSLYDPAIDGVFGIRFQTVFLPVGESKPSPFGPQDPPATEFCTEVYNYQTRDAADPKNVLLLATPQGLSLQQDAPGRGKVFFHSVDPTGAVHRYWLEAEKSEKQVGGAQVETKEEALAAAARGKATAVRIGPSSMGTRFNVQMLIQVPLKQRPPQPPRASSGFGASGGRGGRGGGGGGFFGGWGSSAASSAPANDCLSDLFGAPAPAAACAPQPQNTAFCFAAPAAAAPPARGGFGKMPAPVGTSNAARVSRGTKEDVWGGVANATPERHPSQHGTITVTMYYTVVGGVPSAEDVDRACRDLDDLYKQCPSDKSLVNCTEVTAKPPVATTKAVPTFPPPFNPAGPPTLPTTKEAGIVKSLHQQKVARCQRGHPLTPMHGGEAIEPPHGWWCDGCGLFLSPGAHAGEASGGVKGYGCRTCDFDLCATCAVGPRCPAGHGLTIRRDLFNLQSETTPCCLCRRPFANRAAMLRGCSCMPSQQLGTQSSPSGVPVGWAVCDQCYRVERARCGL